VHGSKVDVQWRTMQQPANDTDQGMAKVAREKGAACRAEEQWHMTQQPTNNNGNGRQDDKYV
jgi:hypothetical protein